MKKIKLLAVSLLTLGAMTLASCTQTVQGEKGDRGSQGPAGPKGDQGVPGEKGQDGATWSTGEGEPESSSGNLGDLYLDTLTGDVYLKSASGWTRVTSLKGEDGKDGTNGADGQNGQDGVKGDKGDKGEDGEDGKDGASWLSGEGVPSGTVGNVGDLYLNTLTGDVYLKSDTGWSLVANLTGQDGQDGLDGVNGDKGDQGEKGNTAWSSTILPIEGGYIVPSVGSAKVGDNVTFTVYSTGTNKASDFVWTINQANYYGESVTLPMVEGGFVVFGEFPAQSATIDTPSALGKVSLTDGLNVVKVEGEVELGDTSSNACLPTVKEGQTLKIVGGGQEETTLSIPKAIQVSTTTQGEGDIAFENLTLAYTTTDVRSDNVGIYDPSGVNSISLRNVDIKVDLQENAEINLLTTYGSDVTLENVKTSKEDAPHIGSIVDSIFGSTPGLENITIRNCDLSARTIVEAQYISPDFEFNLENSHVYLETSLAFFFADYLWGNNDVTMALNFNDSSLDFKEGQSTQLVQINSWGSFSFKGEDLKDRTLVEAGTFIPGAFAGDLSKVAVNLNNFTYGGNLITETTDLSTRISGTPLIRESTSNGVTSYSKRTTRYATDTPLISYYQAAWDTYGYSYLAINKNTTQYPTVRVNGQEIAKSSLLEIVD